MLLSWISPPVLPDGRDAAGLPRVRIDGVPARLLSAGPRSCRWTTIQGHRLVLEGERLRVRRDGGPGSPEILLRTPLRADLPDGGLAAGLAEACTAASKGALLAHLLGLLPMQDGLPSGTRLHLHDARTFSIAGRVLLDTHPLPRGLAAWLGPAAAPLVTPWRLAAAAIETAAEDPPPSAHARLALRMEARRLLPRRLRDLLVPDWA